MNGDSALDTCFAFRPVAVARTPFREKFGIPRQSGLLAEAEGRVELLPPCDREEAFRGLDGFSHVWLLWAAHRAVGDASALTVRPPRLGGNRRVGVFASRSPFRPNPIGLSLVRLERVEARARPPALVVSGLDLLDGTPVLDVKPYLPYSDAVPDAAAGFAPSRPARVLEVGFSKEAETFLTGREDGERLRTLIAGMIELDPRPAYRGDTDTGYGFRVEDVDVHWQVQGRAAEVTAIRSLRTAS